MRTEHGAASGPPWEREPALRAEALRRPAPVSTRRLPAGGPVRNVDAPDKTRTHYPIRPERCNVKPIRLRTQDSQKLWSDMQPLLHAAPTNRGRHQIATYFMAPKPNILWH